MHVYVVSYVVAVGHVLEYAPSVSALLPRICSNKIKKDKSLFSAKKAPSHVHEHTPGGFFLAS